jgi:hypothetical protein
MNQIATGTGTSADAAGWIVMIVLNVSLMIVSVVAGFVMETQIEPPERAVEVVANAGE